MSGEVIVAVVLLLAFAYLLIERWQIAASEPVRDELLQVATEMMDSQNYSEPQKMMISDMLDEAMDRGFMVQMVVRLPGTIWLMFRGQRAMAEMMARDIRMDEKFTRFLRLHQKSTAAANPLFFVIFRIEVAIVALLIGFVRTSAVVVQTAAKVAQVLSAQSSRNHGTPAARV